MNNIKQAMESAKAKKDFEAAENQAIYINNELLTIGFKAGTYEDIRQDSSTLGQGRFTKWYVCMSGHESKFLTAAPLLDFSKVNRVKVYVINNEETRFTAPCQGVRVQSGGGDNYGIQGLQYFRIEIGRLISEQKK